MYKIRFENRDILKRHSFFERYLYTKKRKWFCKKRFIFWMLPYVATDMDILIDYAWRDVNRKSRNFNK